MAASYPGTIKTFSTKAPGEAIASSHINDLQNEIVAVETQLVGAKLNTWTNDGWIPVSSTWTYASDTTINVPSGAGAIYKVGQGIRVTANGVVLQAYIVGVADTLLTTAGNALTNHTFSAISYTNTPGTAIGFPVWFTWTPSVTYSGGTTDPTGWVFNMAKFMIVGALLTFDLFATLTRGSGDRTYIYFTLAVAKVGSEIACNASECISTESTKLAISYVDNQPKLLLNVTMANNGSVRVSGSYPIA
jgi:hypothetical protein